MERRPAARVRRAEEIPVPPLRRTPSSPCRAASGRASDALDRYFQNLDDLDAHRSPATDFGRLRNAGIDLPEAAALGDEEIAAKLWEVIGALAALRVYLGSTDHLGDRELYTVLWTTVLRQEVESLDERLAWHVDLICGAGQEATRLYLKHYADERERRQWAEQFPDDPIPAHEDPPFDRDRKLPRP